VELTRWFVVLGVAGWVAACGLASDSGPDGVAASGGTGAISGSGGIGGTAGTGAVSGNGGSGGTAGTGAISGSGGIGGTAGSAGTAGTAGSAGTGAVGGSSGSGGSGGGEPACSIDRDKQGRAPSVVSKVYFGTTAPTLVDLFPEQILAIGKVELDDGAAVALCSGTLIAPRWVLSAKHCTPGVTASGVTFFIGYVPGAPDQSFSVSRIVTHPSADVALFELTEDATTRVAEIVPIRLFAGSLDSSWIGRRVEAAGYGETENETTGTRYFTAEPIDNLSGDEVWVDGEGQRGLCGGDSGGPLLTQVADGSVRVIGELQGGDSSCIGVDHYTRVDLYRDWIEGHVGITPDSDQPLCAVLGGQGRCSGSHAIYCANTVVQRDACGGSAACGWDSDAAGFRCVDPSLDPCGGLDARGTCEGDVASACVDGVVQSADCGACGLVCATEEPAGANCIEEPVDPCESLDYLGRCEGNVAEWCDAGEFKRRDCAINGQACGWRGDQLGFYCG